MRVNNDVILNEVDLTVNQTSEAHPLYMIFAYAIQAKITGTVSGSLKLQGSCDESNPQTWTDILNSSQAISAAGTHMWNVTDCGYAHVRVVWTFTSGAGPATLSATINKKGW